MFTLIPVYFNDVFTSDINTLLIKLTRTSETFSHHLLTAILASLPCPPHVA